MRQAVILAGGKGTRLRSELGDLPKPLVEVGGVPLLARQVALLERSGYSEVLLLVNHGADQIVRWCAAHTSSALHLQCIDDGESLGTASATLAVYDRLDDDFLVTYGDTLFEVDLLRFESFHRRQPDVAATLFLHPNDHPHDSDLVEVEAENQVIAFHAYPHGEERYLPNLVNAALYCVRKAALESWRETRGRLDFGKDLFPAMLSRGLHLQGYISPEYIKDVGTPTRLARVRADVASGRVARACLSQPQKAVFLDRDGTLNRSVGYVSRPEQFELLAGVGGAVRRLNRAEYKAVVVTNQPVVARGDCTAEALRDIHNKMETLLARDEAYLDRICVCPHHPDAGFEGEVPELKLDCACRKPGTGMIEQAAADLNVDLGQSWMVGDSTVDLLTARRAGLRSILVETGEAGMDGRHWVTPDFTVSDLAAAVDFILDAYPWLLAQCAGWAAGILPGSLVFIGGLSRSGKTTLANALAHALALRGMRAHVVAVDRWLRSEAHRKPGVLGRYDLAQLERVVQRLSAHASVELEVPAYDKRNRRQIERAEQTRVDSDDVVILEGTVSLPLAHHGGDRPIHTWFVEIEEAERRERVLREYLLRGESRDDAERIYQSRQHDETPVILASAREADRRIVLPLNRPKSAAV